MMEENLMGKGHKFHQQICIVGSIAEKEEIDVFKNVTEVFLLERRLKTIFKKTEDESAPLISPF